MGLTQEDLEILACPRCGGPLEYHPLEGEERGGRCGEIGDGILRCRRCPDDYAVRGGLPLLVDQERVRRSDRMLRPIYDFIAPFHDLGVEFSLPVMQFPDPGASRQTYIDELALRELRTRPGRSPRVLEVGIGAGANLPLVGAALPYHVKAEIWGVDLSAGMLDECRQKTRDSANPPRLLLADAHALPFGRDTFDRVFHVGGINGYGDPGGALAEMARVARPGTPIVVVDEELDPARKHSVLHRLAFRALTWYDPAPSAPIEAVPNGAEHVSVKPVSRFYYCLSFRMPAPAPVPVPGPSPEPDRPPVD